jgi:hypothetical protein
MGFGSCCGDRRNGVWKAAGNTNGRHGSERCGVLQVEHCACWWWGCDRLKVNRTTAWLGAINEYRAPCMLTLRASSRWVIMLRLPLLPHYPFDTKPDLILTWCEDSWKASFYVDNVYTFPPIRPTCTFTKILQILSLLCTPIIFNVFFCFYLLVPCSCAAHGAAEPTGNGNLPFIRL